MTPVLTGRVAIVTGGGRGLGRAIAAALGRAGATVAILGRSERELLAAVTDITAAGGNARASVADVTESSAVDRALAEIGTVDVLVNNAGTLKAIGPPWELDPAVWWRDVETSLLGTFLCSRAVLPGMIDRGGGRIVNLTSSLAGRPAPYLSGYAAAKAAVLSFTEALAAAGRDHGVRVFALDPGFVETEMTDHLRHSPEGRAWAPDAGARGSVPPERAATLAAAIASGAADALSGRLLYARDDLDALLARVEEIDREDLRVLRLRR